MDDDWRLLEAWQAGDNSSGEVLLGRYFKPLDGFFRKKVGHSDDVADLVSDTMLECSRSDARPMDGVPFRSFLFSIGLNVLRRYFRKRAKRDREAQDFESIFAGGPGDGRSMTSMISLDQQGHLVTRALRKLSFEQQLVLELSLVEGLNGPEIAELLDVPRNTVYTRLQRGTERLRYLIPRLAKSPEIADSTMIGIRTWAKRVREEAFD